MPEIETFWLLHENNEMARIFVNNHIAEKVLPNSVYQFIRAEITRQDKEGLSAMFKSLDKKSLDRKSKTKAALN